MTPFSFQKPNFMRKVFILGLLLLGITLFNVNAQDLPAYMTEDEKALMPAYLKSFEKKGFTTPPPHASLRNPAEWEEMQAVAITWRSYQTELTEIVRFAREECDVYIICNDSSSVKTSLTVSNVNLSNIYYLQESSNSVWIRDYGPNCMYVNDVDSLFISDWIYNRPRPLDDVVPQVIADYMGIPLYETTVSPNALVHTGGNFCSDGLGTAFSENLVLDENSNLSTAEVDTIMKKFMGIERYVKITNLPYDGIHHIDMHFKLINEETLLVAEYPTGVADGPQIETNLNYILSNFNSVFGTPYKVIRIPSPPSPSGNYPDNGGYYRTYTNSLILNNTVLVPTYYEQYDTTALRIYREAMPGYNIVGINCNNTIPASGAIHCISHELATANPLLIVHQNHRDTNALVTQYDIDAMIIHKSGIQHADIYYRTDTLQPYTQTAMVNSNPTENLWSGSIPAQAAGSKIYYYIKATATSGKVQLRPMPAPEAYFHFRIMGLGYCVISLGTDITIFNNETVTMEPTVVGTPPFNYLWSDGSSDPDLVVDGALTGLGTFNYSVTVTDVEGYSDMDSKTIEVINQTGIETFQSNDFRIYPNPVLGECWIEFSDKLSGANKIGVFDINGKLMIEKEIYTQKVRLDLSPLANGVYQLRVANAKSITNKRLIVQ